MREVITSMKKSTIAKLLAEEDISVVHKKTKTASFDVKKRELVLPIFKEEISNDVYDMFVCHEVGHSLWTPLDMLEQVHKHGIDKSVVNVIEDARIEAMIQNRYPGSRKNFTQGYKELLQRDFFGINKKDITKLKEQVAMGRGGIKVVFWLGAILGAAFTLMKLWVGVK